MKINSGQMTKIETAIIPQMLEMVLSMNVLTNMEKVMVTDMDAQT